MMKYILAFALLFPSAAFAECFHALAGVGNVPCTQEFIDKRAAEEEAWRADHATQKLEEIEAEKKKDLEETAPDMLAKTIEALANGEPIPDEVKEYARKLKETDALSVKPE